MSETVCLIYLKIVIEILTSEVGRKNDPKNGTFFCPPFINFTKNGFGPKKSVQTDARTPSMIENFEKNKHILTKLKNDENGQKSKN